MKRSAFTLIELLVVIAIIAILAAILFPVFAKAKESAKKAAGMAQMKQIGTAMQMYATDYDDGIPTWNVCLATYPAAARAAACPAGLFAAQYYWDVMLMPYVKHGRPEASDWSGLWQSPGAEYRPTTGRSIGMNQLAMWNPIPVNTCDADDTSAFTGCYYWLNLGQVDQQASTMYIGDSGKGGRLDPIYYENAWAEKWLPTYVEYHAWNWATPWRYSEDGANYVWMDTHARFEKGDKIYVHPGRTFPSTAWPTLAQGRAYCAAGLYQAGRADIREYMRARAAARGVTCDF